jgi:D-sedoheptulose 7-phosphate isomerase
VVALTAIGNDAGHENLFVYQLRIHYRPGDKLIAISASGNSPNVVEAARWVKKRGGRVVGLVGFDGGELKRLADVVIHAKTPKGEYGPVEDIHIIMDHLFYSWLKARAGSLKT